MRLGQAENYPKQSLNPNFLTVYSYMHVNPFCLAVVILSDSQPLDKQHRCRMNVAVWFT